MLFRTLQFWYDLFSHGDGRSSEYRDRREHEYQQWRERQAARERRDDLKHEWKMGRIERDSIDRIEAPSQYFYETADGYRAAKLVEEQRYEQGRSKRYRRNLTEAHEQAEDAEQEGWAETLREAFEDFDAENKQNRIDRLKKELSFLETPQEEPNWEEINKTPARGWAISNNGKKYRQMVELRSPNLTKEEPKQEIAVEGKDVRTKPVERGYFGHVLGDDRLDYPPPTQDELKTLSDELLDLEPDPWEDVDWEAVNEQAKQVKNGKQALQLAEEVDQPEVSDFWLQLAEEYDLDEIEDEENGDGRKR